MLSARTGRRVIAYDRLGFGRSDPFPARLPLVLELTPYITSLKCPVLALHGDADEYGSAEQPRRLCALAPTPNRLVILARCGHVPHRDLPGEVLEAAAQFLA